MKKLTLTFFSAFASLCMYAQYPVACGSITSRNNSNGQANTCAGVSGTLVATNFASTIYATVPSGAKTADITFKYLGVNYLTLKPYAITKISQTVSGVTTVLNCPVGPAGVPSLTGSNDALVKYCVYVTNIPTAGTINFELTNPETGTLYGACFYDGTCAGNCPSTGGALAVEMNSFKAKKVTDGIMLEWATANEFNTWGFDIEKSSDGKNFVKIDDQQVSGTGVATYSYMDYMPNAGANYYRLKIRNNDGSFQYSKIVQIKDASAVFVVNSVQPNPFISDISIDAYSLKTSAFNIQVLDFNGKVVAKQQTVAAAGTNQFKITNLTKLNKGIYVLKISCGSNTWQQKIIK
ncbi:MAG: T9SS type A sorting domain-containing protein [Ferruginibacter sp.]